MSLYSCTRRHQVSYRGIAGVLICLSLGRQRHGLKGLQPGGTNHRYEIYCWIWISEVFSTEALKQLLENVNKISRCDKTWQVDNVARRGRCLWILVLQHGGWSGETCGHIIILCRYGIQRSIAIHGLQPGRGSDFEEVRAETRIFWIWPGAWGCGWGVGGVGFSSWNMERIAKVIESLVLCHLISLVASYTRNWKNIFQPQTPHRCRFRCAQGIPSLGHFLGSRRCDVGVGHAMWISWILGS